MEALEVVGPCLDAPMPVSKESLPANEVVDVRLRQLLLLALARRGVDRMLLMLCEYDVHLVDRQFGGLANETNRLEDVRRVGVSRAIAKGQDDSVQFLLVSCHVYRSSMETNL